MTTRRALWIPLVTFAVYEVLVWSLVYRYFEGFHPTAFAWAFTICGVTVLAIYFLVARVIAQQPAATDNAQTASQTPAAPVSRPDVEALKSIVTAANFRLAESQKESSERIRTTIHKLPLFLLLGTEESGKTSTFIHSGLAPELLAGQVYKGDQQVIPTPLSNIWLAHHAVFLEMSGRVLSSQPAELASLLKVVASKKSTLLSKLFGGGAQGEGLRGAILCCDIGLFLGVPDPNRQSALIRRIRENLNVVGESFRVDFPVYVIFTKADKIASFTEYFERLQGAEGTQVLGSTLNAESHKAEVFAEAETHRLTRAFNSLYHSLAEKRLMMLARETVDERKLRAYEFPRELKRIRSNLIQFLVEALRPNPLHPGPVLRGFYFVGTRLVSADEDAGSLSDNASRPGRNLDNATVVVHREELPQFLGNNKTTPAGMVTRWTFATELFSKVILKDPMGAPRSYGNRRMEVYRRLIFCSAMAGLAMITFLIIRSWRSSEMLMSETRTDISELPSNVSRDEVAPRLARLDKLRDLVDTLQVNHDQGTRWASLGLYVGNDLLSPARKFYYHRFYAYLLSDVETSLKRRLSGLPPNRSAMQPYAEVHQQLKGYLSITSQACDADAAFLTAVWRFGRPLESNLIDIARRQFAYYVLHRRDQGIPLHVTQDADSVSRGRRYLDQFDPVEGIYRNLLEHLPTTVMDARLADYSRRYTEVIRGPDRVQAAFTKEGAKILLDQIASARWPADSCVFDANSRTGALSARYDDVQLTWSLKNRYIREYIETWRKFLGSLTVPRYESAKDAARRLGILTESDSAVLAALYMVEEHTTFSGGALSNEEKSAPDPKSGRGNPRSGTGSAAKTESLNPRDITKAFQPVHVLFSPAASRTHFVGDPNQGYLDVLRGLQESIEKLATAQESREANSEVARTFRSGLNTVKGLSYRFDRLPEQTDDVVKQLLTAPIQPVQSLFTEDFGKADRAKIDAAAMQLCKQLEAFRKKYPFSPKSSEDASLAELSALFAYQGGYLWSFYQEHLKGLMEEQNGLWAQRVDSSGQTPKLTPEFLKYFNRLAEISAALFPRGGGVPGMEYQIKIAKPANAVTITVDDGTGPRHEGSHSFKWPSTKFTIIVGNPGPVPMASYEGVWGLFNLLAESGRSKTSRGVLELTCVRGSGPRSSCAEVSGTDGKPVVVQIQPVKFPNGVERAFDRDFLDLTHLKCPTRATQPQ